jgi:hypothetical protein
MSIPGSLTPLFNSGSSAAAGVPVEIERSLRFNSADSAFLSRTPASSSNRKTWTWAGWVKRSRTGGDGDVLFSAYSGSANQDLYVTFVNSSTSSGPTDGIALFSPPAGNNVAVASNAVYRDHSAWYHIVVACDTTQATAANRVKIYVNGTEVTYNVTTYPSQNQDLHINNTQPHALGSRPNGAAYFSGYLADIHFIDGQQLTPSSFTEVSATTGQLIPLAYSGTFGTNGFWLKFSDNSAATAATLGKDYSGNNNDWTPNNFAVSGVPWATSTYLSSTTNYAGYPVANGFDNDVNSQWLQNTQGGTVTFSNFSISYTSSVKIKLGGTGATVRVNGGTGQTIAANSFISVASGSGTLTSLSWQANGSEYPAIYGIQIDDVLLVAGVPGDIDSLVDTPTSNGTDTGAGNEVRGNYATWNPLNAQLGAGSVSNGNLDFAGPSGSANYNFIGGTFAIDTSSTSGWYFEFTQTTYGNGAMVSLLDTGFQASALSNQGAIGYSGTNSTAGISYANEGSIHNYGSTTSGLTSWTSSGDIISIAIKNNKIWFAKNGTWISGSPSAETSPSITLASTKYVTPAAGGINSSVISLNAGQRAFAYTAPSGFKALCDTNLGAPLVAKPNELMDVALYTGNGSTQTISGLNFSPDFVWIKQRSGATSHTLHDTIRGTQLEIYSDSTSQEYSQPNGLTAFNSNGFTLGSQNYYNGNGLTFAAWAWDAGTSTDPSNTAGSITSQVRANVSAGFSVVTFNSGNSDGEFSVGHGLGVAPRLIIMKSRTRSGGPWWVHHLSATDTTTKYLQLSTTSAVIDNGGSGSIWGAALPTSTVFGFSVGAGRAHTQNEDIVSYAFSPVVGYSSMGSYVGNGSSRWASTPPSQKIPSNTQGRADPQVNTTTILINTQ